MRRPLFLFLSILCISYATAGTQKDCQSDAILCLMDQSPKKQSSINLQVLLEQNNSIMHMAATKGHLLCVPQGETLNWFSNEIAMDIEDRGFPITTGPAQLTVIQCHNQYCSSGSVLLKKTINITHDTKKGQYGWNINPTYVSYKTQDQWHCEK